MITAVITDDEIKSAELLQLKLKKFCPQVEVLQFFTAALPAIAFINEHKPDVIFLDIEMPELNGLSVAKQLDHNSEIVFVTAYDKYSIDAIRLSAFDYLLKPVDEKQLVTCIQRLEEKLQHKKLNGATAHKKTNTQYDKIAVPSQEGVHFINVNDIIKVEAESNYSVFYFTDKKKLTVSKTLKQVEDALEGYTFFRPHKSFIINLGYIKTYIRGEGGTIIMTDGSEVEVSRTKKKEFLEMFSGL
jgi:two-component system, LytTR family, response regulator